MRLAFCVATREDGGVEWRWVSVWPIWLLAVVGAVTVALVVPDHTLVWLPIVLGGCTLAAFGVQLAGPTEPGLVDRLFHSVAGSIVVLAIATAVLLPLALLR